LESVAHGTQATSVMITGTPVPADSAHAIQLALTPVFLLTGIAGLLGVMASRLARIIDRGRRLTEETPTGITLPPDKIALELRALERRRHFTSAAITACTVSALLVCLVIAMLFVEALLDLNLKWVQGMLFTGATVGLIVGLAFFLREVHLATQTVRIESQSDPPTTST
jgi:hypothetical protein